jgi:hypothetical protein
MAEHPEATFPADEGTLCPELYSAGNGSYSICYAEYKIAGTWHLDGATATVKQNAITLSLIARTRWRRRWVKCNLRLWHVPGTLVSNNNCGLHQPQVDAYFIWNEAYPGIRSHLAVHHVGWLFADSAGFNSIGRYHAHKIGRVYTFTNAVGDSFRYTP